MKKVDYIIVGDGYAALFFAHQLIINKKSFVIFSDDLKSASQISAGVINPVVLKKFTTFWKAQEQIDFLIKSLKEIEAYTGDNYFINAPIHRIFHDENEQNLWLRKSQNEELIAFLDEKFDCINGVKNDYLTGKVNQSARLDVRGFFDGMKRFFINEGVFIQEKFVYSEIDIEDSSYKNYHFSQIVFCEGMGVKENPYFQEIPVQANKGHHIRVKLDVNLSRNITIKKKHFLFPLDNDLYFYGGTYDREQLHHQIDESAVQQLKNGLSEFYLGNFEVKETHFGFRPTVRDRRPILGRHTEYHNLYVFNGLGARGILNGCYFAKSLFDFIETDLPLPREIDINRFI